MKVKKEKYPLHPIDKYGGYTPEETERFMIFLLLDRATNYEYVCRGYDALDSRGLTTRNTLKSVSEKYIGSILKSAGYRFHSTSAKFIKQWSNNPINLTTATREELVNNINGIGYKLASMFLRNTRRINYAVLDIHTKRWLQEQGIRSSNYIELEEAFIKKSQELGMDIYKLDMSIWEERRR